MRKMTLNRHPIDITPYQATGAIGLEGGYGPPCTECGVSSWVELAGGPAPYSYHQNIDRLARPEVDIIHDFDDGTIPLHDEHAAKMKFIDVLNYLTQDTARLILQEVYRVLQPGGSFVLRVVDLPFVCKRILEDGVVDQWLGAMYHSPDASFEGFHRWGYSFETLKEELEAVGFINVTHKGHYNQWEFVTECFKA